MQRAPERPLRHGFPDSVPCSPQKQACEWLGRVLVGQDLSGTVDVACPPRDEPPPPGVPDASVNETPWKGEGPGHPSLLSDLQGKSFQTSWPDKPESETSSGEEKDLPGWPGPPRFAPGLGKPLPRRTELALRALS